MIYCSICANLLTNRRSITQPRWGVIEDGSASLPSPVVGATDKMRGTPESHTITAERTRGKLWVLIAALGSSAGNSATFIWFQEKWQPFGVSSP